MSVKIFFMLLQYRYLKTRKIRHTWKLSDYLQVKIHRLHTAESKGFKKQIFKKGKANVLRQGSSF